MVQKFDILPGRHTWLEAIQRSNDARRTILSRKSCDAILQEECVRRVRPVFTGTAAAVGAKGKSWRSIEAICRFDGKAIETIFDSRAEKAAGVVLVCDHGFNDGVPAIGLYDHKGKLVQVCDAAGNPIGDMPERVFVRFNGPVSQVKISMRAGGALKTLKGPFVCDDSSHWLAESAVLGLLSRNSNDSGWYVELKDWPNTGLGVVVEQQEARPMVFVPTVPYIEREFSMRRESEDTLVVKGPPEKIEEAMRLLGPLVEK